MKPITLTKEAKENALEIFKKLLDTTTDSSSLKINITAETLLQAQGIEKPTVFVLATAYVKMMSLINNSDKELAWYGVATRVNTNYFIEDILVYPQTVTSATVDADEEKCAKWFMELSDETINNLKFQGHSHVTMSATPSGRDTNNWQKFANLLKPGEFYILCIGNQRGDFYWNIYDTAINVCFENKDITMVVVDDKGNSITNWAKDSIKKYIVEEKPISLNSTRGSIFAQQNTTVLNGQRYDTFPETDRFKATYNKTQLNSTYKEMLSFVPKDYTGDIDYDLDADMYFTDLTNVPGFVYNSVYRCYICSGPTFRTKYNKHLTKSKKEKKNK